MRKSGWPSSWRARFVAGFAAMVAFKATSPAQIRDGGIDPKNLGKGQWIYQMPQALAQMNGAVPAVTNLTSLMAFLKNLGMKYVIIKAASADTLFPSDAAPQFTAAVVNAGHAASLWVFGYNRSYGLNMPGEIAIADYVFEQGADGFVFDAESEWESQNLPNNATKAVQLCSAVRSNWPTKFLAHAPFPYITLHSTFPYKEFGYYRDVVMPQDYWNSISLVNCSPSQMVSDMSTQWRNWQNSLSGQWTNSIKPICPVGNFLANACNVNAAQITEFVNALKNDPNPATATGYKGVNYWVAEGQSAIIWEAIRTNDIGSAPGAAPVVTNVAVSSVGADIATLIWTTDQSSDSMVEYGLTAAYGSSVTNSTMLYYHTVKVTGLSNNTTYQFRAKSKNASNQTGASGNFSFTTLSAPVADIYLDDPTATFAGSWSSASSANAYGGGYRWSTTAAGGTAAATFRPTITTAGKYEVYVTFIMGVNRATNAPRTVVYGGGTTNVSVNQNGTAGGSSGWVRIASGVDFVSGTSGYVRLSNNTGYSGVAVIADGMKLVYVPPPPSPASITVQPANQTTNQGSTVKFTVTASGTAPLTYQWKHEGMNLPGATTSSYVKTNVQPADAGNYSVTITNSVGSTNSNNARLTVVPFRPPHIDVVTILADGRPRLHISGGPGSFTIDQSPNLTDWTQAVTTNVSGPVFQYTDPQTDQSSRYYRVRLLY